MCIVDVQGNGPPLLQAGILRELLHQVRGIGLNR